MIGKVFSNQHLEHKQGIVTMALKVPGFRKDLPNVQVSTHTANRRFYFAVQKFSCSALTEN